MKETMHTVDVIPKVALMPVILERRAVMGEIDTESESE